MGVLDNFKKNVGQSPTTKEVNISTTTIEKTVENEKLDTGRFKDNKKIGCIVAIRAAESLDRRVVLKQGRYEDGRYGTQYDVGVHSPFMDLSTEDLWKMNSLCGFEINDIYSMMWDANVPLAKQRIGSPVNSHSGDAVKLYKVLNPDTYGKMVGRLGSVDFTASYGGVFNNGFKYIKLDQPRPFHIGIVTDPALIEAINYLGLDYTKRSTTSDIHSEEVTTVRNSATEPIKTGDNIKLVNLHSEFIREFAARKADEEGDAEKAKYFRDHLPKMKNWYDYMLELVNGAEPMYQKSWKPKVETSIKHWESVGSCVNETCIVALRTISNRKNKHFGVDDLDYEEFADWSLNGYTDITQKPILRMFRYNQDCPENLARAYVYQMVDSWDKGGKEEFEANNYLYDLVFGDGDSIISKAFSRAIDYAEMPSSKDIHEAIVAGQKWEGLKWTDKISSSKVITDRGEVKAEVYFKDCGVGKTWEECSEKEKDERVKAVLCMIAHTLFHDSVRESASWKRVVVACLRNDTHFTYLSFGQSSEEKLIRVNAEAMFAANEAERKKKMAELEKLKKKIDSES